MQILTTVNEQILSNLRDFELFNVLSEAELKDLAEMSRIRTVSKHRFVFNQGDKSDYLYFLIQGNQVDFTSKSFVRRTSDIRRL